MLHTAVVPIDRHPIIQRFLGGKSLIVMRIAIAQEVPRRTGPLRHGVGLASSLAAAFRTGAFDPIGERRKRTFTVRAGLIRFDLGQLERQLFFGNRNPAALIAFDKRNRLAPVSLTGEYPVAKLEVDFSFALAVFGEPFDDLFLGVGYFKAV